MWKLQILNVGKSLDFLCLQVGIIWLQLKISRRGLAFVYWYSTANNAYISSKPTLNNSTLKNTVYCILYTVLGWPYCLEEQDGRVVNTHLPLDQKVQGSIPGSNPLCSCLRGGSNSHVQTHVVYFHCLSPRLSYERLNQGPESIA